MTIVTFLLICKGGFGQPVSAVATKERDSIIRIIKEKRNEEKMPGFLYMYDQVDTSMNLLKIYNTTLYDLSGFDYSKNLLDFLKLGDEYTMYLMKRVNGYDSVTSYVETNSRFGFGFLGMVLTGEKDEYNSLLQQINIQNTTIFWIESCQNLFVCVNRNVYIFVNGKLLKANPYLEQHYTLKQLADLFNPRY
jgi:hypothetical protein